MKNEYVLKGLCCPHCAAKIERAAGSLPGVLSASCSAVSSTLTLDAPGAVSLAEVERIVHKYEPDVEVSAKAAGREEREEHGDVSSRAQALQFAAGILTYAAAAAAGPIFGTPGLRIWLFLASYAIMGWRVVYKAARNLFGGRVFDENFLMTVATAGAFLEGDYAEAAAVMLFYLIGETCQDLAVRRSRKSIASLMGIRPDFANLKTDSGTTRVSPESVSIGDLIIIKPGEKIPLDGMVTEGESSLDAKALTGESVPMPVGPSSSVLSGCVNQSGALTVRVSKAFGDSTAAKILELVENAGSRKAPAENFITAFARYYTPAVVGLAVLLAVLPPLAAGGAWADWIHRALVFLVISCPCALVISVPLSYFGGIGRASRDGILVKGGNYLEALSKVGTAVFDKTGTLTKGTFDVRSVHPAKGFDEDGLLRLAAAAEAFSNHPIAASILAAHGGVDKGALRDYKEYPGEGAGVTLAGERVLAGGARLMEREGVSGFSPSSEPGAAVYVAYGGRYAGRVTIADEVKDDSARAIAALRAEGVSRAVMLTGDGESIAAAVAREIGLDEFHASLLPEQKVELVERMEADMTPGTRLAFVGDGINDAPVLARADVGIAMGGLGSDAAIEAADVVLMTDEPHKLALAIKIAKATKRVVWQNIIFILSVKAAFLALGAAGVAGMWEAVFADMGVSMIATFNALRVLRFKFKI